MSVTGPFMLLAAFAGLHDSLQSAIQALLEPEVLDRAGAAVVGAVVIACVFMVPRA